MKKAYSYQLISYKPLLKLEGINFREDDKCLTSGVVEPYDGWAIFVSCKTKNTPDLLNKILPYLKDSRCIFRLIKDQNQQYRLNSGNFGEEEVGKVISIFPKTIETARQLSLMLLNLTTGFKGPVVLSALRIGEVLYVQKVISDNQTVRLTNPQKKEFPFTIPTAYLKEDKTPKIIGRYYLPIQTLRSSPKGSIYKAINLKKMAFTWCLIKEGKPMTFDDHFDRDMKDRLLWQKEAIKQLENYIKTPCYIDYFERKDKSYLVLDFAEGDSLGHHVRKIVHGNEWRKLNCTTKARIIRWYLEVIQLTEQIHSKGFVHRDITDSNFIVLNDDSLCIIDHELCFSLIEQEPNPPFLLGTFGYLSPEQLHYQIPDVKDDIYSLGALLSFMVTGVQPHIFLTVKLSVIRSKLSRLTGSCELATVAVKCLHPERNQRPDTGYIRKIIKIYLQDLFKGNDHENLSVAI